MCGFVPPFLHMTWCAKGQLHTFLATWLYGKMKQGMRKQYNTIKIDVDVLMHC